MADRYPIVVINGELKELPSGDTIPAAVVPSTFLGLTDTPSAYTSQALKAVRVNAGETALEFYTPSSGITIGSTAITSGTNGAILFQGSGTVQQDAARLFWDDSADRLGVNTNSPSANVHVIATSNLFRAGYDTSNYVNLDVSSSGVVTLNAVGSGAKFVFSDAVEINGSLTLSAQNIVTDTTTGMKIGTSTSQKLGFFGAPPVTQQTDIGAMVDSTSGTPGLTVQDVGGSFDQSVLNDNFASIVAQINALRTEQRNLGLMA